MSRRLDWAGIGLYTGGDGREAGRVTLPHEPDERTVQHALLEARAAKGSAHAPYSRFRVGAAVVDAGGTTHRGCNVESASFGLTLCAERNALSSRITDLGGAADPSPVVVVAISTDAATPTPPCGACRQWLAELAPGALVVSESGDGAVARWSVEELLPGAFRGDELGA